MCGASLKHGATSCEYCGTQVYDEKEKMRETTTDYSTNYTNTNTQINPEDQARVEELEKAIRNRVNTTINRTTVHFSPFVFFILFIFMPPFAFIYLIYIAMTSHKK